MVSGGFYEEFKDIDYCICIVRFKFVILLLDYLMVLGLLFELFFFKYVM